MPESGDEIQTIKSGLMEIADAFIVNKADRDGADVFANTIKKMVQQKDAQIPVFKTIASQNDGIAEVANFILSATPRKNDRKEFLLAEKAYKIIQQKRMAGINKANLQQDIAKAFADPQFNLYDFVEGYV